MSVFPKQECDKLVVDFGKIRESCKFVFFQPLHVRGAIPWVNMFDFESGLEVTSPNPRPSMERVYIEGGISDSDDDAFIADVQTPLRDPGPS